MVSFPERWAFVIVKKDDCCVLEARWTWTFLYCHKISQSWLNPYFYIDNDQKTMCNVNMVTHGNGRREDNHSAMHFPPSWIERFSLFQLIVLVFVIYIFVVLIQSHCFRQPCFHLKQSNKPDIGGRAEQNKEGNECCCGSSLMELLSANSSTTATLRGENMSVLSSQLVALSLIGQKRFLTSGSRDQVVSGVWIQHNLVVTYQKTLILL